jgi:hypothetical protein
VPGAYRSNYDAVPQRGDHPSILLLEKQGEAEESHNEPDSAKPIEDGFNHFCPVFTKRPIKLDIKPN